MKKVHTVLAAVAAGSAALVTAASAPAEAQGEVTRKSLPMTVAGFDVAKAQAAGNSVTQEGGAQVLRDPTGREISRVPASGAGTAAGQVTAAGTGYGDRGRSYIEIYDEPGDLTFSVATGFDVEAPAVDFSWAFTVSSSGGGGGFRFDWDDTGPMFPDSNWTSGFIQETTSEVTRGYYHFAEVTSGTAFLIDGRVCYSGLPSAVTTVW